MKYKLYDKATNDTSNIIKEVLKNRGIDDYQSYLHLTDKVVIPWENLDNMFEAVNLFESHYSEKNVISILVDEDPDGFCSAAMMYLYIKEMDKTYPVEYIMHRRVKSHGLSDDVTIPSNTKLLIVPDAGTNDVNECKELKEHGIDILILDHHEKEVDNPYAIIVNNQMSGSYENKNLCGAGVVYRFLQALDNYYWTEYADDYLDLCALANISDVMDMRSFETRYFTNTGLRHINSQLLQALIKAQDYSMGGKVNIHNVQWNLTTILNGMIRVGSLEEKDLLFRAFTEQDEFFEYKKRATKDRPAEVIQESIYDRAARLCKNAKSRQDKMREKATIEISELVKQNNDYDKVIIADVTDILDSGLTGVVAIKIADIFKRPCVLLKKHKLKNGALAYGGSARNLDNSPIESFKDVLNSTGLITAQGHANACGIVDLPVEDKDVAIKALNEQLKDIIYDSTYYVDFILEPDEVTIPFCYQFEDLDDLYAQGIKDCLIAVENIELTRDQITVFGKNEDTISFMYNDVKYIMFKCKPGNGLYDFVQDAWSDNDVITFDIVGVPGINEYDNVKTAQVIIKDVNVIHIVKDSESRSGGNFEDDDDIWG